MANRLALQFRMATGVEVAIDARAAGEEEQDGERGEGHGAAGPVAPVAPVTPATGGVAGIGSTTGGGAPASVAMVWSLPAPDFAEPK